MRKEAGFSLLELLIAVAIMFAATGAIFSMIDDSVARSAHWDESAELHQRARVAAETATSHLRAAGAGTDFGPLHHFFPAVDPRRRGAVAATQEAVTVRTVPDEAPRSRLTGDLVPGGGVVGIVRHAGCAVGTIACGFNAGMDALVYDGTGNWDTVLIQAIAPDTLTVVDRPAGRALTYTAGTEIVQVVEEALYFDAATLTLRREHPGVSDLPVLDNVVGARFDFFGQPEPPLYPRPPAGTANCLYDATGARLPQLTLPADYGALTTLPAAMLSDGPMCGSGATAFDLDLLRIRLVRASLRLQAGSVVVRGSDPILFARPGTATARHRMVADVVVMLDIAPANLQR